MKAGDEKPIRGLDRIGRQMIKVVQAWSLEEGERGKSYKGKDISNPNCKRI